MRILILLLTLGTLLTGCSKRDESGEKPTPDPKPGEPVYIRLYAGLSSTRAVVGSDLKEFTPTIMGWEAASGAADYSKAANWAVAPKDPIGTDSNAMPAEIVISAQYNDDPEVYTHIKSWYPQGSILSDGVVRFDNPATDGTQDILYAREVKGSKTNQVSTPLEYRHPLTQIKVALARQASLDQIRVRQVSLRHAALPVGVQPASDQVVYASPTSVDLYNGPAREVEVTPQSFGWPVMVKPFARRDIYFDVQTENALYANIKAHINDDQSFIPGKAYTITLTFRVTGPGFEEIEISAEAVVSAWESGNNGGGIVE